ncbi:large ribosomal subunit protein bL20m-like [Ciona intestinalis]
MFLTNVNLRWRHVIRKPDKWWRVQRLKEQAKHYFHRSMRNRYGLASTQIRRSLMFQTKARVLMPYVRNKLRDDRLNAACEEHNARAIETKIALRTAKVALNKHMLTILAMYEPRTFKSLVELAQRTRIEQFNSGHMQLPDRCFTKEI